MNAKETTSLQRLEDSVEIGTLCAFYGGLLTPRQREAVQLHYNEDLSLGEIAEQLGGSRQNVHELITRSVEKLRGYETALGTANRMADMLKDLNHVHALLSTATQRPDAATAAAKEAAGLIEAIIQKQEEDAHGI